MPPLCGHRQEIAHPDQVVGGRPQDEDPVHEGHAPMMELAELADGLQPPEDPLHPFPAALAQSIARVPGRPAIDGAGAVVGPVLGTWGVIANARQPVTKAAVSSPVSPRRVAW